MKLSHLSGRCRMGDPDARRACRRILLRGLKAPAGSPEREEARKLARLLASRTSARSAFLPDRDWSPNTELGRRLFEIFKRHGGTVMVRS